MTAPARPIHLTRRASTPKAVDFSTAQSAIINSLPSRRIIFGGPGTGKTTTLIAAAAERINRSPKSESVLVLTYGRDAASEIRDRIAAQSGSTTFEPLARTFHSLAFSILNEKVESTDPSYVLISGAEQDTFIRQLLETHLTQGLNWHEDLRLALPTRGFARELRDLILRATERDLTPNDLARKSVELQEPYWIGAAEFWQEYQESMALQSETVAQSPRRIDPSAVITEAIHRLKREPELLNRYRKKFTAILVDEFHESDKTHRQLLELIVGDDLLVFADPDSTVGRFRGADPDGISDFCEINRLEATVLGEVFRSAPSVFHLGFKIATNFRGHGPTRDRVLATGEKLDRGIDLVHCESASDAAAAVAYAFRSAHLRQGLPWSEMAVIVRAPGPHIFALTRAFAINGIPVVVDSDVQALSENPAIKPLIQLAQICLGEIELNLTNWPLIEELLLSEFGGGDAITLRRIRTRLAQSRDESEPRSVSHIILDAIGSQVSDLPWDEMVPIKRIHDLVAIGKKSLDQSPLINDLLWAIWSNATNYDGRKISDVWRESALRGGSRGAAADRDLDAMMELFESARRYTERMPGASPSSFIAQLMGEKILGDTITAKGQRDEAVCIITVHSAKGREWELVALAGMQEGSWPNYRERGSLLGSERLVEADRSESTARAEIAASTRNALIEDERRLLHVAVTRAKSGLIIPAVTSEEFEPSAYFEEIYTSVHGEATTEPEFTLGQRSLTSAALVSELRHRIATQNDESIDSSDREYAASLLQNLSKGGIAAADPKNWLGTLDISSTAPLVAQDQPISVSPSNLQSFAECGVKWFLERSGGRDGDSTAQVLGSAIHHLAAQLADDASLTEAELTEKLRSAWSLIDDSSGWVNDREFRSAATKLKKFYDWHLETSKARTLLGAEVDFRVTIGRVILRGSVDRIELTADGKIFIADLKTGQSEVTHSAVADHRQLMGYQLAVLEGGFSHVHPSVETGGAELVYLGGVSKGASTRTQSEANRELATEAVVTAAEGMSGATFIATINKRCSNCGVKSSCPIQSHGRSVIE
ncbi:MAG: ATP-dependent DNA helicase [Actinomycetes bacterium]